MIEIYPQNFDGTWFAVALLDRKIVRSWFGSSEAPTLKNVLDNLPFDVPFEVFHEPTTHAKNILTALKSVFDGKETSQELPLSTTHLPAYTKKVLKTTMAIPIGYVTTYGTIAKAVGGGARAVGNAMATNPYAPIVPCHRVVKSDFKLGGYGGGLKVKVDFLKREKRGFSSATDVEVGGALLRVYPVEFALRDMA